MSRQVIIIGVRGETRGLYGPLSDAITKKLGKQEIRRASHVDVFRDLGVLALDYVSRIPVITMQPEQIALINSGIDNTWWADLLPSNGPVLGPFATRDAALAAEATWLEANRIPIPE